MIGCAATEPQPAVRFAVLPTNALVAAPPELSHATSRVLGQITRYLSAQGRERNVIDPLETRRLWVASIAEANESDSVSHDFDGAMKILARRLGGPAAFDALVVSSLVYREAWLRNRRVKWDGAVRRLRKEADESVRVPESFAAAIPAVSLHLMVFDAQGKRVFENYGGVDVAHALTLKPSDEGELHVELLDPVLGEHRFLREGVELAFHPFLPRRRANGW
jgi:hypothetical protein